MGWVWVWVCVHRNPLKFDANKSCHVLNVDF